MFETRTRPATQIGSPTHRQSKDARSPDQAEKKLLKPTEPFWKSTEPPLSQDPSSAYPQTELASGSRCSDADLRTLIIGPGVSVKGEITSCNRLIVQGKIEAKLADCPNVIIKEGGVFNGESTTEDADVQGSFDGNLTVRNRLLVRATGRVSGKITYGEIEIERGGGISGEIRHESAGAALHLKTVEVA
jgi:cytoskeletal protein CcmA (bactofilin family)